MQNAPCNNNSEMLESQLMLKKMESAWSRRAQVRKDQPIDDNMLDPNKPDFLEELLPFCNHPDFKRLSTTMKNKILSCGWLAYNEKTIAIETKIISPACVDILYGHIPGVSDQTCRQIISETLIDEAYHVLLTVNACKITLEQRKINITKLPQFSLERNMVLCQDKYTEKWKKRLVSLCCAIVSEIFISNYLDQLSGEFTIQPINRLIVEAHRKDELAHHNIFIHLSKCIYGALSAKEREFFSQMLPLAVKWFADTELDIWESMLKQIGLKKYREIIEDSRVLNADAINKIDYSGIIDLAGELGILDDKVGRSAFEKARLLQ